MKNALSILRGDRTIWALTVLLAILSFLPVYSAGTQIHFSESSSVISTLLFKHMFLLIAGFGLIGLTHYLPIERIAMIAWLLLIPSLLLLAYTLTLDTSFGGVSAKRWIKVPLLNMNFQPSTLSSVLLMVCVASYLAKVKGTAVRFRDSILPLWIPIFATVILVVGQNFSTAALIGFNAFMLCFMGGYPLKYLMAIGLSITAGAALFFTILLTSPEVIPSDRAITWKNRVESFMHPELATDDSRHQITLAKIAVAEGGVFGKGAGKSVIKNRISQSTSDFIYAIIVEEYGLVGGLFILLIYILFLFRITVLAYAATSVFAKLLIVGLGLPIVFQAFLNMAVVVELVPVTGQPLPLISMGGTSIWMTCIAIGIVLSATSHTKKKEKLTDAEFSIKNLSRK
jgi:cell division protein FtsW